MRGDRRARDMGWLVGRTVLVTGGGRRIGAAICRHLHRAGANVVIHYRASRKDAANLQRLLERERPDSTACVGADLLDLEALATLVSAATARFRRLDAIVNNASSFYPTPLARLELAQWQDLVGTNLQAPLFLAKAARAELSRRGGAIVSIADVHAERPLEGHLVYSIAKAGLVAMTRALARELAPSVRVNAVAPGAIAWPESGLLATSTAQAEIVRRTPLGRTGTPDDIARAVHYLLAEAPFVTGQVLAVDGGRSVVL